MNNKKGFTLVEVIAVIILLIVITLIAVPAVLHLVNSNKNKSYEAKMEIVLSQAKQYARDNEDFLYDSNKRYYGLVCNTIGVDELYSAGYLKELSSSDGTMQNITDPRNNTSLGGVNINVYIYARNYDGNNIYAGSIKTNTDVDNCISAANVFTYGFTGDVQVFTAPSSGNYRIEAWGASGGSGAMANETYEGGKGAYTAGTITLNQNESLYLYVGGRGTDNLELGDTRKLVKGGWNGGGAGGDDSYEQNGKRDSAGAGGGSTDVALESGAVIFNEATYMDSRSVSSYSSRIMVAAGGGGGAWGNTKTSPGSNGGALKVKDLILYTPNGNITVTKGSQTDGNNITNGIYSPTAMSGFATNSGYDLARAGGGGGYYTGYYSQNYGPGAGGTSYISGHEGCVALQSSGSNYISKSGCSDGTSDVTCSYHQSGKKFTFTEMASGADEMPETYGHAKMTGNVGDGFIRITKLS